MLKNRVGLVVAAMLGFAVVVLPACKTDTPGVRSNYYSQWTTVDANVEQATEAVETVMEEDLELREVEAHSTRLDGEVVGFKADGTKVSVAIRRVTDQTSEVSAYAGRTGDPEVGKTILARLQDRLNRNN